MVYVDVSATDSC